MADIYIHIRQQHIPNSRTTEMPNEIQPSITLNNCVIRSFFKWGRTCETHVTSRCLKCVCALICDSSTSCVGFLKKTINPQGSNGLRGQQSIEFQENHFVKASRNCSALRPHRKPYSSPVSVHRRAPGVAALRWPHLQRVSGAFKCRHVSIGEGRQEGTSGRGTKKAKQVNVCRGVWLHIFKGSEIPCCRNSPLPWR